MGKSKRAEMLRALGAPRWSQTTPGESAEESGEEWHHYEKAGEIAGTMNVVVDQQSGIIKAVIIYPQRITKQEAILHFGRDFIVTRYDFDPCPEGEDSEPMYESPKGPVEVVEYRSRGIAISVGYNDLVTKISYVAGPIGATRPRCKQSETQVTSLRLTGLQRAGSI